MLAVMPNELYGFIHHCDRGHRLTVGTYSFTVDT